VSKIRPRTKTAEIPITSLMLAAAFVSGGGCQSGDEIGSIGELYLDWNDVLGQQRGFVCGCYADAGYVESVELCYQPAVPPPLEDCIAGVIDRFDVATAFLECQIEQQKEILACMTELGCGGDLYYECYYSPMLPGAEPCPQIPYEAERAIAGECYGATLPDPFTCADGTQIPETWQCDEEADCADQSDEQGCPAFVCGDGSEIPISWQCDASPQCADLSDEQACPNQFTCDDGYGIPLSWQCDGEPDCGDGSDEAGC
jgi:hypothetical protein